ncbi:hypothetical protein ABPG74_015150 [Tetrahymena malaccensis]
MSEPVKEYYTPLANTDQNQYQNNIKPNNQYPNYSGNNDNQKNNMGYEQMGQPIGQPINPHLQYGQNGMYNGNNYYPQAQSNGFQAQNGIQGNSYQGSSGSNQFYPQPMYGQPQYQPPGYAQGVPIEAQVIRAQGSGSANPQVPMLTNLDNCEYPTAFRCNFCQKESVSTMTREPGTGTWMACCCLFFCTFGVLSFIPFCTDSCQDKKHFCPFCGAQVGFREYKPCG